ncbi:hypothetical protein ACL02T_34415 [Pseudonocardia sp. RS010]|uniref:hypothetical protein n=1 Tax=Pseudonocardia sp. RS010 TaxID=3385979 RepID=UPI00399F641B
MVVVAVLFQVWELTRSPWWTGAIGVATAVPTIVLGLFGARSPTRSTGAVWCW